MINKVLVAASLKAFEDILSEKNVPYEVRRDEEYEAYKKIWDETEDKNLPLRKVRPAIERIASKEPYLFETSGEPLSIRLNYLDRKLERDSFGEMMLERSDFNWRFTISIKNDARVLASKPLADRNPADYMNGIKGDFSEIDDFGADIFEVPCSNQYFDDMNDILLKIPAHDDVNREEILSEDSFIYDELISPMLGAIGREMPNIFRFHPEAPQKLIDFFYGRIDYYYISPIDALEITRIGAVNPRGGLGRIPGSPNHYTPQVGFPAKLLEVRPAIGKYGELSRDTVQFTFDEGWAVCLTIRPDDESGKRIFTLNAYLPVTPFGSYRDQVKWDPEN